MIINLKCSDISQLVNSEPIPIKSRDYKKIARVSSLIITSIFFVYVLFYLFYKKDPQFSTFSFIAITGLMFGLDDSIISRLYLCLLNSLLLLPIAYNFFYNIDCPSFYYYLLFLYLFTLFYFMISSINIKTTIFFAISTILIFLMVFLCQKYYFTDIASI